MTDPESSLSKRRRGAYVLSGMREIVRRHFWKVVIIILVILAAIFFAPRLRTPPTAGDGKKASSSHYRLAPSDLARGLMAYAGASGSGPRSS
jgi:hypothetical protein